MYAIIESGSKQYWVTQGETLKVEKLEAKEGSEIVFSALWTAAKPEEGKADGASKGKVTAEVLRQAKGPKVIVFKKRPKSTYRRTQGHRQHYTEIRIKAISVN